MSLQKHPCVLRMNDAVTPARPVASRGCWGLVLRAETAGLAAVQICPEKTPRRQYVGHSCVSRCSFNCLS